MTMSDSSSRWGGSSRNFGCHVSGRQEELSGERRRPGTTSDSSLLVIVKRVPDDDERFELAPGGIVEELRSGLVKRAP
jgi:hypothetical protein